MTGPIIVKLVFQGPKPTLADLAGLIAGVRRNGLELYAEPNSSLALKSAIVILKDDSALLELGAFLASQHPVGCQRVLGAIVVTLDASEGENADNKATPASTEGFVKELSRHTEAILQHNSRESLLSQAEMYTAYWERLA